MDLVENASAAKTALEGAGIKVEGESDVIVMDLSGKDRPGTLGVMARKVADAEVRVRHPSRGLRLYRRPGRCVPHRASERSASDVHPPTGPDSSRSPGPE